MIDKEILGSLIHNEEFARKTLPFLKAEYFEDYPAQVVFNFIHKYMEKYSAVPSKDALLLILEGSKVNEHTVKESKNIIKSLKASDTSEEFLLDKTEEFCKRQALHNAIATAVGVYNGTEKNVDEGALPKLLQEALNVAFDLSVGHDYIENAEDRYEFYHRKENRVPTGIDLLDKVTKGGFPKKSLSAFIAGTGAGKSLVMCSLAANNFRDGKNVLYITAEMSEEMIGERIDANILDVTLDELKALPKNIFEKKIARAKEKYLGKIIIAEFGTGTGHIGHFRHLLSELRVKKNFVPDIIYIDYLNICASSRIRNVGNSNSYTIIKTIAEEFRELAIEMNVPIVTATQTNREGLTSSDIDMTNTSESIGLVYTLDSFFSLYRNEEMDRDGHILVKQLKNRWGDLNYYRKFNIGVDRPKMKVYNLDNPTEDVADESPVMSTTPFGERMQDEEPFRGFK